MEAVEEAGREVYRISVAWATVAEAASLGSEFVRREDGGCEALVPRIKLGPCLRRVVEMLERVF